MPLLGKKSFKPNPLPNDLRSAEEVFVIKETNEVFRSYDEYVNRIILYGFQVWSCQLTGKTNLKYGEAVASEEQALKRLESFPKSLEKPILQLVHHSTCALQTLVQQCYKYLEKEYVENEPVECYVGGKWHQGRISRIHRQTITGNKTDVRYDIECESMQDCLKDVPSGDINSSHDRKGQFYPVRYLKLVEEYSKINKTEPEPGKRQRTTNQLLAAND